MACTCGTEADFKKLERQMSCQSIISESQDFSQSPRQLSSPSYSPGRNSVIGDELYKIKLPRGGWIIQTTAGNIQFGIPPETVKDCIVQGISVPNHYIVPKQMFDKKFCISFCEFEFPAYFNFFVKKKRINLICTKEEEEAIRTVFQQTLLGPEQFDNFEDDFYYKFDKKCIPNIKEELATFGKNPFNPSEPLTIDLLIKFTNYDENNVVKLEDGVEISKKDGIVNIHENGILLGKGKDKPCIKLVGDEQQEFQKYGLFNNPAILDHKQEFQHNILEEVYLKSDFKPPAFGITVLGCSHGFDPTGSTSGYILWINGRGIMIDPPAFSTIKLKQMGIPLYLIGWIFISHCHADHDAGAFQQILGSQKIEIITTKTILQSFIRKYSSVTGMSEQVLKSLFSFRPAIVGAPCIINGASLHVFYSLHTIPCIGFICKYKGKSIYFSGDTYFDPENMKAKFLDTGIMTPERFHDLNDYEKKFNHDIVLHEAGVPPIHTPIKVLSDLPENIKENILLVHVSKSDIPEDSGLKVAKTGLENTYVLFEEDEFKYNPEQIFLKRLNLISSIPIFSNAPLKSVRDLLESLESRTYMSGDTIVQEGDEANEFFIVEEGVCQIASQSKGKEFQIYYNIGDYFGESALQINQKRMANVTAITNCQILALKRHDFHFLFSQDCQVAANLQKLLESRQKISIEDVSKNEFLSQMNSSQKIQFEMILQHTILKKGEYIWKQGEEGKFAFLTSQNGVYIEKQSENVDISEGVLIAEVDRMFNNKNMKYSLKAHDCSEVEGFKIEKNDFIAFLKNNPGFYTHVMGKMIIR